MRLVNCSDCNEQIPSKARKCSNCGVPQKQASALLKKSQKKTKREVLFARGLVCLGIIMMFSSFTSITPTTASPGLGLSLSSSGLVWLLVEKLRTWWRQGTSIFFDFADDAILK